MEVKLFGFISCHASSPTLPGLITAIYSTFTHYCEKKKINKIQKLHLAVRFHKVPHEIKFNVGIL